MRNDDNTALVDDSNCGNRAGRIAVLVGRAAGRHIAGHPGRADLHCVRVRSARVLRWLLDGGHMSGVISSRNRLPRPYKLPNGDISVVLLVPCICQDSLRKGPIGGVCGRCGNAIPSNTELERIKGKP